ncbi:DoxX family protein [Nocardia sp. NPDC004654]|uniref:DoxX family protein n=1 Tax=Nocardia sp. NPDC004654 TaxID=3154776 RepID=UPI0033A93DB2
MAMTNVFQRATDEKSATVARNNRNSSRIRSIAFWVTTLVIVFELVAGSVWNLVPIEWIEIQLQHLGYPHFLAYVLGAWQVGAAVAIIAPGLPLIKEWAYAGAIFLWSGAVASHLAVGDGIESWSGAMMFAICAIASWMLRPADRRLPRTRLRRDRTADAGQDGARLPEFSVRGWAVAIGVLVVLYAVSFLTLPVVEDVMHENAIQLGWIED